MTAYESDYFVDLSSFMVELVRLGNTLADICSLIDCDFVKFSISRCIHLSLAESLIGNT